MSAISPLVGPWGKLRACRERGRADWDVCRRRAGLRNRYDRLPFPSRLSQTSQSFRPDRRSTMFTTATNFLARHAFVVMPKTHPQTCRSRTCSSAIRCRTGRCCTTAACSLSSTAARPRRCGCCCTIASPTASRHASIEFNPRNRPLGRHLERVRSRPRSRAALPLSGRRPVRPRARASASTRRPG